MNRTIPAAAAASEAVLYVNSSATAMSPASARCRARHGGEPPALKMPSGRKSISARKAPLISGLNRNEPARAAPVAISANPPWVAR